MDKVKESDNCQDGECPYKKPHYHVVTNDGTYVKYVIDKSKRKRMGDEYYAYTWR